MSYDNGQQQIKWEQTKDWETAQKEKFQEWLNGPGTSNFTAVNVGNETIDLQHLKPGDSIHITATHRHFESGAVRDTNTNKPFIHCLLGYTRQRFGYHMSKNASKYGENNFLKGIPTEAYLESMDRHLAAYLEGDRSEDHLSALLFGVNGIMLNEKRDGIPANHYFEK